MNDTTMHDDHKEFLSRIARRAMTEHGLLADFSPLVLAELSSLEPSGALGGSDVRDQRNLLWCSIDDDDSRDLDQLSAAESIPGGGVRLFIAIADVDAFVKPDSQINAHALHNTCTVYTAAEIFFMLPQKLSTGLTSLNFNEDRFALVMELTLDADGTLASSTIYRSLVRNKARLNYDDVALWLEGATGVLPEIAAVKGLETSLLLQDSISVALKKKRSERGALDFDSRELHARFSGVNVSSLEAGRRNRARDMIENMMVAANGVVARFLSEKGFPTLRRVVKNPKRWNRIVAIAAEHGAVLPPDPDPKALSLFLNASRAKDPENFAELSLAVLKLLGAGEYVAQFPGDAPEGHFGLAVKDYSHSTAPNRRYPDLVTHRLLKAALAGVPSPYGREELTMVAERCTMQADTVNKVERRVGKSASALLLESRIGQEFEAMITGAAFKGTWLRLLDPPVEGRLVKGEKGLDVGDRLRARLVSVDPENGYIDFEKAGTSA